MKRIYQEPLLKVIVGCEDILTSSPNEDENEKDYLFEYPWWD